MLIGADYIEFDVGSLKLIPQIFVLKSQQKRRRVFFLAELLIIQLIACVMVFLFACTLASVMVLYAIQGMNWILYGLSECGRKMHQKVEKKKCAIVSNGKVKWRRSEKRANWMANHYILSVLNIWTRSDLFIVLNWIHGVLNAVSRVRNLIQFCPLASIPSRSVISTAVLLLFLHRWVMLLFV